MGPGPKTAIAAGIIALLAVPLLGTDGYILHIVIMFAIFAILAASLDLIVGVSGLLSLGHTAFFGLGAYGSALLYLHTGVGQFGGMIVGAALAAGAALVLGAIILNVRGHRFVITTVAFAEIMRLVSLNWMSVTNGRSGLAGVFAPTIDIPGLGVIDFNDKVVFYYFVFAIAGLSIWTLHSISHSPKGREFIALRENEQLAETLGIDTYRASIMAFTIGGAFAGLAGSLYAHYFSHVGPDVFAFSYMSLFLTMVVVGGKGTIWGPVLGAFIFTVIPEVLRFADEMRLILLGATMVFVMLFFPEGIVGVLSRRRRLAADTPVGKEVTDA